jgi:hypothetical protein
MADGFLETHYAEYERRREAWLKRRKFNPKPRPQNPEDEAL